MKPDYAIELIKEAQALNQLAERLASITVLALDIETVNWWNRHKENISLVQLAFRAQSQIKVAVIDALAKEMELEPLRPALETAAITKVMHNASFDASRLALHYKIKVSPVYDTMLAARRSGERRYSLQSQAHTHLGIFLDKTSQCSDWSRRPLDIKQFHYAAQDAYATLLLYEHQLKRNLDGAFQLKSALDSQQRTLPLLDEKSTPIALLPEDKEIRPITEEKSPPLKSELSPSSLALLGIISELPGRYHPEQLAVSVGAERIGMAGWIVDRLLGRESDFDEDMARLAISELCEKSFVRVTEMRRLEATEEGKTRWQQLKTF